MSAVSIRKLKRIRAKLDRDIVRESNGVKLLGIILNNKLKFDKHVSNIYSKVNRKLSNLDLSNLNPSNLSI